MRLAPVALTLALACGCRGAPAASESRRVVRDGTGREVRVPLAPRRIVSLAPSMTEIAFALGAGDRLVGVDRYSDWPPAALKVPRVGGELAPSLERLVALKPDVVLAATSANRQETVDELARLGVAVYVSRGDQLEDVFQDITGIGAALGREDAAHALVAGLKARLAAVRARVAGRPRPRTAIIVWAEPLVVVGPRSHVAELLDAAGGANIAHDANRAFPTYSLERLIARAPEVLIVGSHKDGGPTLGPIERLKTLPAVREGRTHAIDGDLLFRPGPRLAEGAERLAALLHPEAAP